MFKRLILSALTAAALLVPAQAAANQNAKHPKVKMAKKNSPFLITSGLPHYTMVLKKVWNDPALALTPEQKTKLIEVRKATIAGVMALKPKIMKLQRAIVSSALKGGEPASLYPDVERLASLKAEATKIHLRCIADTRKILTPAQLAYLNGFIRSKRK
ncbi:Spy/CpxP family protein refolding chaperone [Hydrogenimonas sp.]